MELLEAELRSCADAQRKEEIKSEMRVLRPAAMLISGERQFHVTQVPYRNHAAAILARERKRHPNQQEITHETAGSQSDHCRLCTK
jgi:hypothetical protein